MDIRIIIKIDELLKANRAGNTAQLAEKLDLSIRTVYNYLTFMKTELNAPITYNTHSKCYSYEDNCGLCFRGREKQKET